MALVTSTHCTGKENSVHHHFCFGTTSTERRRKQFDQFIIRKLKAGSVEQFDQDCGKMFVNLGQKSSRSRTNFGQRSDNSRTTLVRKMN